MATLPVEAQQQVAAHEVAHIVLRHSTVAARVAAVGVFVATVVIMFGMVQLIGGLLAPSMLWLIPITIVELAGIAVAFAIITRAMYRNELEADAQACAWGYHFTDAVQSWTASSEPRFTAWLWYRPLRNHPLPSERRLACERRHQQ